MGRLSGRTAVVTGAARGIGAAEAIRLAQDGANVAVLDLSAEACRETVEAIEAAGPELCRYRATYRTPSPPAPRFNASSGT